MATRNGIGKVVSADATGTLVTLSGARNISVYNAGSDVLWAMVDTGVSDLVTAIAAGTAVPIPGSTTYVFSEYDSHPSYNTVAVGCATGETATAYIGAN